MLTGGGRVAGGGPAVTERGEVTMGAINTGDTAFVLVAAALVMFMTPGLALLLRRAWCAARTSWAP